MIDINILRENSELVKQNCIRRGMDRVDIDGLVQKDCHYRNLLNEIEGLRARRNALSKDCKNKPEARSTVKQIRMEIIEKEKRLNELKSEIESETSWIPNFLSEEVPDGCGDVDNQEVRRWGKKRNFNFSPLDHQALGEKLDIIDTKRAAKVVKTGFFYWKGKGAELASALFFWAQQELIKREFTLFFTPCAAKESTLFGTGYLPFFADETYELQNEDLALIGTSEQTLIGYHGGEILNVDQLPLRYTAFTPCFRTEAGSYGKQTRGIFRVHQFHKVEQVVFCEPAESEHYHHFCLDNEEHLLQQLHLPFRVVNVCVGDLGAPGYKKYDVEAFFPGFGNYREVCSNTNLTDFQSRRLGIRYAAKDGRKHYVHTISATAVTDRVVCAILENNQQEDGTVVIPEVLQPYTGFKEIVSG